MGLVSRILGAGGALFLAAATHAATLAQWTEATASGDSIRAVVDGACPVATVDGKPLPMTERQGPSEAFPGRVCQAMLPAGAKSASIDGAAAPVPPAAVNRIVVLGDTGCRLKGSFVQDCNDPAQWPFAAVAARAAAEQPDLVIHVGDYYYRETPCPAGREGCAGSPHGDAWPAWNDDFFAPARPLLEAARWVFVRGNHEQCGRGGVGWFRLLDAGPVPLACPASAASFAVRIGGLTLDVVDSADTVDDKAPADKVALFRGELDALQPALGREPGWILTHRPIWGFAPERSGEVGERDELPVNLTERQAAEGENLGAVQLVLSGHVHIFTASSFGPDRPAQLIVGNGGDVRDGDRPGSQAHKVTIAGEPAETFVVEQFGYLVLDRDGAGWKGTLKAATGGTLATCTLRARALACRAA
jgi:hypothetical protein